VLQEWYWMVIGELDGTDHSTMFPDHADKKGS
jgi:hypothetical protein